MPKLQIHGLPLKEAYPEHTIYLSHQTLELNRMGICLKEGTDYFITGSAKLIPVQRPTYLTKLPMGKLNKEQVQYLFDRELLTYDIRLKENL